MRDSFVFYKDWVNAIKGLPAEVRLDVYDAVTEYAISGKHSDLKPMAKIAFDFIRPAIDRDYKKYSQIREVRSQAGKNGAGKRWQKMANDNKNSKCHLNVNDNVNVNENENKEKKFNKKTFRENLIGLGADPQHVNDWLLVREKKKAAFTQSAYNRFVKECEGKIEIAEAVRICAEKSWQGFKYEWVKDELKTAKHSTIPNNEW